MHDWLTPSRRKSIIEHIQNMWSPGESVLCSWVEYLHSGDFLFSSHDRQPTIEVATHPQKVAQLLSNFNGTMSNARQSVQSFPCPICFRSVKGAKSVLLSCSHATCFDCLNEFWSLHITEGSVDSVTCPHTECIRTGSTAKREEVQRTVSDELLLRWDWLKEKQRADRDPGVIHCPCCQTAVFPPVVDPEDESGWSRLRNCGSCSFAFCSVCRRTW
jgi:E3 ubiquitin-protein ligase RNF14